MFKAVVEQGGFNQAAAYVHKSTSSIHHAVSKLEDTLGIKLFSVEGRKTLLTDSGRVMLRRAEYLLAEAERVELVAKSLSAGIETELCIAVDGAFPQHIVFQALEAVSSKYPDVNIDIIDTVLSGANELLAEGRADIALSPFHLSSGLSEQVCTTEFVAVAHKAHALHQGDKPLTKEMLKPYRQIIVRDSAIHSNASAGWLGAEQRWTVGHVRASIALIEQNLGYAWLPLPELQDSLNRGVIKALNLAEGGRRSASFYMNYLDKDLIGPAAKAFISSLLALSHTSPSA